MIKEKLHLLKVLKIYREGLNKMLDFMQIENMVKETIGKYSLEKVPVKMDSDLLLDLQFDSIRFIQLIIDLETLFEIEFLEDYLLINKMDTVEKIFNAVKYMVESKHEYRNE